MFTLFDVDCAISILYKKPSLREILAKIIYQYEEHFFCNTSILQKHHFHFMIFLLKKDGIAELGYKMVFKRGNRYTCYNTPKGVLMSIINTSAHFKFSSMYY